MRLRKMRLSKFYSGSDKYLIGEIRGSKMFGKEIVLEYWLCLGNTFARQTVNSTKEKEISAK